MRIVKDHDVRKKELLDTAQRLFAARGFHQTTINDIRNEIGIAKGTFYHYFKSKDEILDAIIDRVIEKDVARAKEIAADQSISPREKLQRILLDQIPEIDSGKDSVTKTAHRPENAEMRLKTLVSAIKRLCPIMAGVVRQGVKTGDFHTDYPEEAIDILALSGQLLFEDTLFHWSPEEKQKKIQGYIYLLELLLGAENGSFSYIFQILESQEEETDHD